MSSKVTPIKGAPLSFSKQPRTLLLSESYAFPSRWSHSILKTSKPKYFMYSFFIHIYKTHLSDPVLLRNIRKMEEKNGSKKIAPLMTIRWGAGESSSNPYFFDLLIQNLKLCVSRIKKGLKYQFKEYDGQPHSLVLHFIPPPELFSTLYQHTFTDITAYLPPSTSLC